MKRILVTGGAGFIGSHLCERLVAAGHRVLCFDNFFTGRHENVQESILAGRGRTFEVVRGDVCAPFHFEVDEIFHLACPASPIHYQRNPVRTIQTCVLGTQHSLELALATGARLLIASTSEVYGDPAVHPQVETYHGNVNPIGPRANYDEGKRCAEALAASWVQQHPSMQVRIPRIFNTYGPRMAVDDGRVVSNFVVQALRGEPLTVYGAGDQTRSFMFIDDLVEALLRLMACEGTRLISASKFEQIYANANALPVNLGNPVEFTILQLAELVQRMIPGTTIEYRELPVDDPTRRRPDISRAQRLIDWSPKVQIEEGLTRTIAYFRDALTHQ